MRRVGLLAGILITLASVAHGAEPTGFADFPWGTTAEVLREKLLTKRCESYQPERSGASALCHRYRVDGLSVVLLRLDFEPADSLAGYYMLIARYSYRTLRGLINERFGKPTSRRAVLWFGEEMSWVWEGGQATLIERCGEETSCLEVKTLPIIRKREQERARQSENLFQSL